MKLEKMFFGIIIFYIAIAIALLGYILYWNKRWEQPPIFSMLINSKSYRGYNFLKQYVTCISVIVPVAMLLIQNSGVSPCDTEEIKEPKFKSDFSNQSTTKWG